MYLCLGNNDQVSDCTGQRCKQNRLNLNNYGANSLNRVKPKSILTMVERLLCFSFSVTFYVIDYVVIYVFIQLYGLFLWNIYKTIV